MIERKFDIPDLSFSDACGLWPCGCLINEGGAHRGDCPQYETVEEGRDGDGRVRRWWKPRAESADA